MIQQESLRQKFNFETFASQPEYVAVNHQLVDRTLDVRPGTTTLDFACGTGLVTKRIRDRFAGINGTIIGIDPNPASIEIAKNDIPSIGETQVRFLEGSAEIVSSDIQPASVDSAYFCNAIHEIQDEKTQRLILETITTALKSGGKLVINSAFTDEWAPDTAALRQMGLWKMQAIRALGRKRIKGIAGSFATHPTEHYVTLMKDAGLLVDDEEDVTVKRVDLTPDAMRAIAKYDGFIEGVFSDMQGTEEVPLAEKSDALTATMTRMEREMIEKGKQLTFHRNCVEIIGRKP